MSNSLDDQNGILNIEPLPVPHSNWESYIFSIITLLIILVLAFFIYARYFSARGKYQYKLKQLHYKFEQQQIGSHDTAFQLAHIMQQGIRVHSLSQVKKLPKQLVSYQARWNAFIKNLCSARYSSIDYPEERMQVLFSDTPLPPRCVDTRFPPLLFPDPV